MEPTFPLSYIPLCRQCGRPTVRDIVREGSPIGHAGRPYYVCRFHNHGFCTWDDTNGIHMGNPHCRCGYTSRRTLNRNGFPFYSCPSGYCGWTGNVGQDQGGFNNTGMNGANFAEPVQPARQSGNNKKFRRMLRSVVRKLMKTLGMKSSGVLSQS